MWQQHTHQNKKGEDTESKKYHEESDISAGRDEGTTWEEGKEDYDDRNGRFICFLI